MQLLSDATGATQVVTSVPVTRVAATLDLAPTQLALAFVKETNIMGTWSSGIGKFKKPDPDHGKWGKKIIHWLCKVGLCNFDKCKCVCHEDKESK